MTTKVKRTGFQATGTTVMTGIVKGTTTGGPALDMSIVQDESLSATVTLVANTATITLEAFWEVSSVAGGAGTYYEVPSYANEAFTPWATGTAAGVTKVLPAPMCVYAFPYARCSVRNKVADGLIADTYAIGYNFVQKTE
jgi:hypothetical protein